MTKNSKNVGRPPKAAESLASQTIALRLTASELAALDAWRQSQLAAPSRSEVLRTALATFLQKNTK